MKPAVSRARHCPVQEWQLRELLLYCCNFCSVVESIHAWVTSLLPKCHSLPKWTLLTTWMMERVKWGYTYLVTWHLCNNKRFDSLTEFPDIPHIGQSLAWPNSQHFATLPLVWLQNDVWETSAEIPYCFERSFHQEVIDGIAKCQQFSQASQACDLSLSFLNIFVNLICQCLK